MSFRTTISRYLSLVKFSHTIFAMPFALIGFFLGYREVTPASPNPDFISAMAFKFVMVLLCMVFARSAAMAFNRYLDEGFDKLNPRTAIREIPAGLIGKKSALRFVVVMSLLFVVCTWFINALCFYLSPLALFVILFYSYTKRFTPLCHLVLGLGLSLAPIGAYLALTARFDILPLLFSGIVICWVSGFDILYALQDEEFDKAHGLRSIPAMLGRKGALQVSRVLHLLGICLVICIGIFYLHSPWYMIAAASFTGLLIYEHSLVKPNDISRINLAFATTNGIAGVCYALFVILSLFHLS